LELAGRILALDVGKKRIGLAVSDEFRIVGRGLETLERTQTREDLRKLTETIEEVKATLLLVGKPLHMSGGESRQSEYTREFAERLGRQSGRPIVYWDERLTSREAERILREEGATRQQQRKSVDRMAALLILESYLRHLQDANEKAMRGTHE